jgi:gliding motility-associated-like protein
MRLVVLLSLSILLTVHLAMSQDPIGAGRALSFDGVDDYIDLGNIYDNITLPVTVSAWVYLAPNETHVGFPIFVSQDNLPIYNGFWFLISPTSVGISYGDGLGENNIVYRRGISGTLADIGGRWVHVCGIMRDRFDMEVYVNGIKLNGFLQGESSEPMASNFPTDVAKIGYFASNGIIYHFKGIIDELRVFNTALTESEIRDQMCIKLTGNEPGLVGYWNFDETTGNILVDKSSNHFNGTIMGSPGRVFSGAPLGDKSTFAYSTDWTGAKLSLTEGHQKAEVSNITGNPDGIHIYEVNNLPSQTQDLDLSIVDKPYFGVFVAALDAGYGFTEKHYVDNKIACGIYTRNNNSIAQWNKGSLPLSINSNQSEFIASLEGDIIFDLGPDQAFCNLSSYLISSAIDPAGKSFLWNTGQTSPSISVTHSGIYKLTVSTACSIKKDSIKIDFHYTPADFSLGEDEIICMSDEKILAPINDPSGLDFTWQDGSHQTVLVVNSGGTYWLKIENECGVKTDTILMVQVKPDELFYPNIITPNDDMENEFFILDEKLNDPYLTIYDRWGVKVFEANNYKNDWNGNGLASGTYFYRMIGECVEEKKGLLNILR